MTLKGQPVLPLPGKPVSGNPAQAAIALQGKPSTTTLQGQTTTVLRGQPSQ